jgi:hypothetical protein
MEQERMLPTAFRTLVRYWISAVAVPLLLLASFSTATAQEEEFEQDFPTKLWPFLEILRERDRHSVEVLWPVFKSEQRPGRYNYFALRPFYTRTKDPKNDLSSFTLLWPLFTATREADDTRVTVFPLLWLANSEQRSHTVAFPFFWRYRWEDETNTVVFPFYWRSRWGEDSSKTVLFPFFWADRDGKDTSTVLFPFYWDYRWEKNTKTVLFPFYWNARGKDYRLFHLWPFYGYSTQGGEYRRDWIAAPLFSWTTHGPQDKEFDFLWPLFNLHINAKENLFYLRIPPLLFLKQVPEGESHTVVFPLYWDFAQPGKTERFIFPIYYHRSARKEGETVAFPIYWDFRKADSRTTLVLPSYYQRTEGEKKTTLVFPFYYNSKEPQKSTTFILPNFYCGISGVEKKTIAFPFFWDLRGENSRAFHIWPFYGYEYEGENYRRNWISLPLFSWATHGEGDREYDLLWPLFNLHIDERTNLRYFRASPLFFHKRSDEGRQFTVAFPFYWDFFNQTTGNSFTSIFPIYWNSREKSGDEFTSIFPLYWDNRHPSGDHFTTLFPFYWNIKEGDAQSLHFWPLFGTDRWGENHKRYSFLFPLIWYDTKRFSSSDTFTKQGKTEQESYQVTLRINPLFMFRKEPQSLTTYLFPLYIYDRDEDRDWSRIFLAWPFFRTAWRKTDFDSYLFPLYIYNRYSTDDSYRLFLLWPLFRHSASEGETDSYLFPLYNYSRDRTYDSTSLSLLWPPFLKSWSLFLYESDSRQTSSHLFPLYFYNRNKDGSTWFSVLWPLFSYSDQAEESSFGLLWKLCDYHSDDKGNHHFAILYKFIREEKEATHYSFEVNPFYSYYEQGEDYRVHILGGLLYSKKKKGDSITTRILLIPL